MRFLALSLAVTVVVAMVTVLLRVPHRPHTAYLAAGAVVTSAASTNPARAGGHLSSTVHSPHRRGHHPRRVTLDTTAYCATGSRTASGAWPELGMAASNLFPFGQRLQVPGVGVVVVTDRVGYGSQLDIYMGAAGCAERAVAFGRRQLDVEVLP